MTSSMPDSTMTSMPSDAAPTTSATGNETVDPVTTWVNGTCHKCAENSGMYNGTAPMASPTMPVETCGSAGKCPSSPSSTGSSTGPGYTGAGSRIVTGAALAGIVGVAAAFALL
jgi:hypothetical protein